MNKTFLHVVCSPEQSFPTTSLTSELKGSFPDTLSLFQALMPLLPLGAGLLPMLFPLPGTPFLVFHSLTPTPPADFSSRKSYVTFLLD